MTLRHLGVGIFAVGVGFAAAPLAISAAAPAAPAAPAAASQTCFGHTATIVGTNGPDHLTGTSGVDVIVAMGGNDTIDGVSGNDFVCGGTGKDRIDGGGNVHGGPGNDVISGVHVGTVYGDAGADRISCTLHCVIFGGAGNDVLHGGTGDDVFDGGAGDDVIHGGPGNDEVRFIGAPIGVRVDLAKHKATDGAGDHDVLHSIESVEGTKFGDRLIGDRQPNVLLGQGGPDTIKGGAGNDQIAEKLPSMAAVVGGSGRDRFRAELLHPDYGHPEGAYIDLTAGIARSRYGPQTVMTIKGIEDVRGTNGEDTIRGDAGPNRLEGNLGTDHLYGLAGNDRLIGGLVTFLDGQQIGVADYAYGGPGVDLCRASVRVDCERR